MGGRSGEIWFFLLVTKKTIFFAEIFKIQGSLGPPSDAHCHTRCKNYHPRKTYAATFLLNKQCHNH